MQLLRSLGNQGAVRNAGILAQERRRESVTVNRLERHLAAGAAPAAMRRTA